MTHKVEGGMFIVFVLDQQHPCGDAYRKFKCRIPVYGSPTSLRFAVTTTELEYINVVAIDSVNQWYIYCEFFLVVNF